MRSDISIILQGIKNAADDGKVSFQEYPTQTKSYQLPHCIQLTIKHNNKELNTWGSGTTRDEAALKSVMEMVERLSFFDMWPISFRSPTLFARYESYHNIQKRYIGSMHWLFSTTSGLAVHTSKRSALKNAISELFERHVVLKSLAQGIAPAKIDLNLIELPFRFPENLGVDAFHWRGPLNRHVVMFRVQTNQGSLYGFGCELSRDKALQKALYETSGMMVAASLGIKKDNKILHKHSVDQNTIRNFHLENSETTMSRLLTEPSLFPPLIDGHIHKRDIFYSEKPLPSYFDPSIKLKIVRVVSPLVQPLFFDRWRPGVVNPLAMGEEITLPKDLHVVV